MHATCDEYCIEEHLHYLQLVASTVPGQACYLYRVFRAQADWTLTHTSHKGTEQSTIEGSVTLDVVTLADSLTDLVITE
jgi:hypothetical protein